MGTTIVFAATRGDTPLTLHVDEETNGVYEAWVAAQGLPFQLTHQDERVWVNPAAVAYFHPARSGGVAVY